MICRRHKTKLINFPHTVLICDGHECLEREVFARSTERSSITEWSKRHGWSVTHLGQGKFRHLCPICDRLRQVPASYVERLIA